MAGVPVNQTKADLLHASLCETLASRRYQVVAVSVEANGGKHAAIELRIRARCGDSPGRTVA